MVVPAASVMVVVVMSTAAVIIVVIRGRGRIIIIVAIMAMMSIAAMAPARSPAAVVVMMMMVAATVVISFVHALLCLFVVDEVVGVGFGDGFIVPAAYGHEEDKEDGCERLYHLLLGCLALLRTGPFINLY